MEANEKLGEEKFNLFVILDEFKKCRSKDGQILLDHYLRGYTEIIKLVILLGNNFLEIVFSCTRDFCLDNVTLNNVTLSININVINVFD